MATTRRLLVEGKDDFHVILSIQGNRQLRILDKGEIAELGGVDELLESLPVHLKASEGGVIGVVIDADSDLAARWNAVRDRLLNAGYSEVPDKPDANGTVVVAPIGTLLPRFGIWLMPNNSTAGILEDFVQFLVPREDNLHPIAKTTVDALPSRRFPERLRSKAVIHTWLAWQEAPGRPFGQAITARFLDPGVPEVDLFTEWLQRLYSE